MNIGDIYFKGRKEIIIIDSFAGLKPKQDAIYIKSCKILQDDHDYVAYVYNEDGTPSLSFAVKFASNEYSKRKSAGYVDYLIISYDDSPTVSIFNCSTMEIIESGITIIYESKSDSKEDKVICSNCGNIINRSELFHDGDIKCPYCEFGFIKK